MRNSARALVVLSGVPVAAIGPVLLAAAPALAASVPTTADDPGPGLTVSETLGLFVGIPLLVILVVYALVYGLSGRRGPRLPAGGPWTAEPQWFGAEPAPEVEPAAPASVSGEGGARGQW